MKSEEIVNKVVNQLIQTKQTISTMESCTAGLIASMITDTEGASSIFPGGYVTYLNETKIKTGVDSTIIEKYGVYSSQCAEKMARTAQKNLNTDIAIGITGTTGNIDPNNGDSVQGEVYFCIVVHEQNYDYHYKMDVSKLSRKEIKKLYATKVFEKMATII